MKKTLGVLLGLALASMARGQAIADYAQLISNFAVRLDSGSGVVSSGAVTGGTCTNQVVTAIDTSGVPTCASLADAMVPATTFTIGKLSFSATDRLACRDTAAAGGGEECAVNAPLGLNGSGLALSITTTNDGGAVVSQGSTPGTAQTGNFNLLGVGIHSQNGITNTVTDGSILSNSTASLVGTQLQYAPALRFNGHAWNTGGAADEADSWRIYPTVTAGNPTTSALKMDASIAGGAFSNAFSLTNAGALTLATSLTTTSGGITSGSSIVAGGGNTISFSARSALASSSNGLITMSNSAQNDFTRLCLGGTTSSFPAIVKESATGISIKLADNSLYADLTTNAQNLITANAAQIQHGSSSEQLTLLAAATTDTAANLLPANAHIDGVVVRVTTIIPTAVTFQVGDGTTAGRFCGTSGQFGAVAVAANTTGVCNSHLDPAVVQAAGPNQVAAAKIRITPSATPGAATGVVRITVFWTVFVPPTS